VLARLALASSVHPLSGETGGGRGASSPRCLAAWASLAELAEKTWPAMPTPASAITGASTPYGCRWRGSGLVRWSEPANAGSSAAWSTAPRRRGHREDDEEVRCALMLAEMEPQWPLDGTEAATPGPQS